MATEMKNTPSKKPPYLLNSGPKMYKNTIIKYLRLVYEKYDRLNLSIKLLFLKF